MVIGSRHSSRPATWGETWKIVPGSTDRSSDPATGRSIEVSPQTEATTVGAAYLAGLAVEVWGSFDDIAAAYLTDEDKEGYVAGAVDSKVQLFIRSLVMAVTDNMPALDAELSRYPIDWSFDRLRRSGGGVRVGDGGRS